MCTIQTTTDENLLLEILLQDYLFADCGRAHLSMLEAVVSPGFAVCGKRCRIAGLNQ